MAYKADCRRLESKAEDYFDNEDLKPYYHSQAKLRKLKLTSVFLAFTTLIFGATTLMLWTQITHCAAPTAEVGHATALGM